MSDTGNYVITLEKIYIYKCHQFIFLLIFLFMLFLIMYIFFKIYLNKIKKITLKGTKKTYKEREKIKNKLNVRRIFIKIFMILFIVGGYVFSWLAFYNDTSKIKSDITDMSFQIYEGGLIVKPYVGMGKHSSLDENFGWITFEKNFLSHMNDYYDCLIYDMKDKRSLYDSYSKIDFYKKYYGTIVYGEQSKAVVYWDVEEYQN